jgi:hypothetical protein
VASNFLQVEIVAKGTLHHGQVLVKQWIIVALLISQSCRPRSEPWWIPATLEGLQVEKDGQLCKFTQNKAAD